MKENAKIYIKHIIFLATAPALFFLFDFLTGKSLYYSGVSSNWWTMMAIVLYIFPIFVLWHGYGFYKALSAFGGLEKSIAKYIALALNIVFICCLVYMFSFPFAALLPIRLIGLKYLSARSHYIVSVYIFVYILSIAKIIKAKRAKTE